MQNNYLITLLLLIPLVGGLLILVLPKTKENIVRYSGLAISTVTFILSLLLYFNFDLTNGDFQFIHQFKWIEKLNVSYFVGIDGMSLLLVLLTTFLTPLTLLSSWSSIKKNVKEFTFFMIMLEVGMLGVFVSLDLFLFYIFWEAMLIPMYFIIGIWGGQNRIYAAIKFFLFTLFGSLLMLVAILALGYFASTLPDGYFTTNLVQLYAVGPRMAL